MLGGMQLLLVAQENQLGRPDPSPFKPPKIGPNKRRYRVRRERRWTTVGANPTRELDRSTR